MNFEKVEGEDKGKVTLFALSTCIWCRKTRKLLEDMGIEFEFIYVDLLEGDEREAAVDVVESYNPRASFPTVVIGDNVVVGFKEDKIKELLK